MNKPRNPLSRLMPTRVSHNSSMTKSVAIHSSVPPLNDSSGPTQIHLEPTDSNSIIKKHQPIQTPRSDLSENEPLLHSVSSTSFDTSVQLVFNNTPLLTEAKPDQFPAIFAQKCQQCHQMCDFNRDVQKEEKELKTDILKDILTAVSDANLVGLLAEKDYYQLYSAFIKNVVRVTALPPPQWFSPSSIDFSNDRVEEKGWDHLSLFYDIINTFFHNRRFNSTFCKNLTEQLGKSIILLFQTPDIREREKLMKLFHCYYRVFRQYREVARDSISSCLRSTLYFGSPVLGISEILSILVPIVNGFKIPLNVSHLELYEKVLLPLHRSPFVPFFHKALASVVYAYIEKNQRLALGAFKALDEYWPATSPSKVLLFLEEMEYLCQYFSQIQIQSIIKRLSKIVGDCIADPHFGIVEKALMMWESDAFTRIMSNNSAMTFPIILPMIFKTANTHWCSEVRVLAVNAMRVLKGNDLSTFESVGKKLKQIESERVMNEIDEGGAWKKIISTYSDGEEARREKYEAVSQIFIGCEEATPPKKTLSMVSTPLPPLNGAEPQKQRKASK